MMFCSEKSTLAIIRVLRPCTEAVPVSKFVHRTTEIVGQFQFELWYFFNSYPCNLMT